MKKLLAAAIMILATNAFAKTYYVQYTTNTEHALAKISKSAFQCLPTPATVGEIKIFTADEASHKLVLVKQENVALSPINFLVNITSKTTVDISDASNNISASIPATVFSRLLGKIEAVNFTLPSLNGVPAIENKVKDTVANALGNNNFKMKSTSEFGFGSCNIREMKCAVNINRNYQVDAE